MSLIYVESVISFSEHFQHYTKCAHYRFAMLFSLLFSAFAYCCSGCGKYFRKSGIDFVQFIQNHSVAWNSFRFMGGNLFVCFCV